MTQSDRSRSIDVFAIYNQQEPGAQAVIKTIEAKSRLSVYFWERDMPPGGNIANIEQDLLARARTIVVILGDAGWGARQKVLARKARETGKPIFPILIGSEVSEHDLGAAGALFQEVRRTDLTVDPERAMAILIPQLQSLSRRPDTDAFIASIVDGSEEQRLTLLETVIAQGVAEADAVVSRLIDEVDTRFSPGAPELTVAAARDPSRIPSIRSWILSFLLAIDAGHPLVEEIITQTFSPKFEPEASVRFWALAGLLGKKVDYVDTVTRQAMDDPAPEVHLLAYAYRGGQGAIDELRSRLQSSNFRDDLWPALRVLRVLPITALVVDLCQLLGRVRGDMTIAYDVVYALSAPGLVRWAARDLSETVGALETFRIILTLVRTSDVNASRRFIGLLGGFEPFAAQETLEELEKLWPELGQTARRVWTQAQARRTARSESERYIAGYSSDTIDASQDELDIRQDVQSLTAVMLAKEVRPPLAIGLFGDWGTGKSFFMEAMKATTRSLTTRATRQPDSPFCTQVVTISFNAWHYVDTNLWASLVAHILERLAEHLEPQETRAVQRARLINDLESARAVRDESTLQQQSTQAELKTQQDKLLALQQDRAGKELELRRLRLKDVRDILSADDDVKAGVSAALNEIGAPAAIARAEDLQNAIDNANSLAGRAGALAVNLVRGRLGFWGWAFLVAAIAAPFAFMAVQPVIDHAAARLAAVLAEAGLIIGALAKSLNNAAGEVKKGLDKVANAKRVLDEKLAQQRADPSIAEKTLEAEIAALRADEDVVGAKLEAATAKVLELEQRLKDLSEAASLERFLAERLGSGDYRKHQGLIATVRRDFEDLTNRLAEISEADGRQPIERIVLYIDDLDRCPVEQVADVLQAVHLLLAYPLFVVVVGVDSRWLTHSVAKRFTATLADIDRPGASPIATPQNYLEKIFQIPFRLQPMNASGFGRLVSSLLAPVDRDIPIEGSRGTTAPSSASTIGADARSSRRVAKIKAVARAQRNKVPSGPGDMPDGAAASVEILEEALVITPSEAAFAERLFELLPTPRSAKRFANLYRLLKAPLAAIDLYEFEGRTGEPGHFRTPMLLLAALVGDSTAGPAFLAHLERRLLQDLEPLEDSGYGDPDNIAALAGKVRAILAREGFAMSKVVVRHWLPRINRFSFSTPAAVPPAVQATGSTGP